MRTGHGHQDKTVHSRSTDQGQIYKQSVEYCCGSLLSSLVNYTTYIPHQISALRFTCQCYYWTLVQQLPQHSPEEWLPPLVPCSKVVRDTPIFFSSSSSLQPSSSWLSLLLLPPLSFLLSKPHAQPNVTLPLLSVRAGATVLPHVSTAFLATAFQALQHCFVKCQRGQEKT